MTNNIIKNAVENAMQETKTTVYIYEGSEGYTDFADNIDYLKDKFCIFGNRSYNEYNKDIQWMKTIINLSTDIQCYYDIDNPEDVQELSENYDIPEENILKVAAIIDKYNNPETAEAITEMLNAVYGNRFETRTIKGYCQSDWNEIIYDAGIKDSDIRYIESMYFGMYSEVRIVESENSEYWTEIIHDDLWNIKDNHSELCKYFDVPEDSVIYLADGTITTTNWKEA